MSSITYSKTCNFSLIIINPNSDSLCGAIDLCGFVPLVENPIEYISYELQLIPKGNTGKKLLELIMKSHFLLDISWKPYIFPYSPEGSQAKFLHQYLPLPWFQQPIDSLRPFERQAICFWSFQADTVEQLQGMKTEINSIVKVFEEQKIFPKAAFKPIWEVVEKQEKLLSKKVSIKLVEEIHG